MFKTKVSFTDLAYIFTDKNCNISRLGKIVGKSRW